MFFAEPERRNVFKVAVVCAVTGCLLSVFGFSTAGWSQTSDVATPAPLIQRDDTLKISDHVYVILDDDVGFVPNVGIVVGESATLVIDTGLGLPNGEIVLGETRKVSTNDDLYVVSTHYHSEHELGAGAFPASATMIRSRDQQQDLDEFQLSHAERFSRMSEVLAGLLQGADFRQADNFFDDEYSLDLGGVTVRMIAVGPAHTRGDTAFFVEEDGVLFTGDIAMRRYPRFSSPSSGVAVWREALAKVTDLDVEVVVPSHGRIGDARVVQDYVELFSTLERRVRELNAQGLSVDTIAERLTNELAPRFPDWPSDGIERIDGVARAAYAEIQ